MNEKSKIEWHTYLNDKADIITALVKERGNLRTAYLVGYVDGIHTMRKTVIDHADYCLDDVEESIYDYAGEKFAEKIIAAAIAEKN